MRKPKVSIIVAAYNIADYIAACMDSILNQSYRNLEIIVVDDGSTDDTPKILANYAKQDDRVQIIHQKNRGLSAARNTGILAATSDYLCLIDGDDTILKDYVAKLYSRLEHTKADIAVCGYETISINRHESHVTYREAETTTGPDATRNLLLTQENLDIVAWNKMYKKSLFVDNNVFYPVGEINEDNLTTYKLYSKAGRVTYLMEPLYQYYRRTGSIMDKTSVLFRLGVKERAAGEAIDYFAASDASLRAAASVSLLLAKFAYVDSSLRGEISEKKGNQALKWIKAHSREYIKNPQLPRKVAVYLFLCCTPNSGPYKLFRRLKNDPGHP